VIGGSVIGRGSTRGRKDKSVLSAAGSSVNGGTRRKSHPNETEEEKKERAELERLASRDARYYESL
jgi:hypothetical protein